MVRFARTGGEANAIAVELPELLLVKAKLQFVGIMAGMIGICL